MDDRDIVNTLGRIEGKQDLMLGLMTEDRKRLGAVEKKVWAHPAVSAVLAVLAAKVGLPYIPH